MIHHVLYPNGSLRATDMMREKTNAKNMPNEMNI